MSLDNQIYHALAEQTADHILVTDPDGLILYVNPAFTTVTGYRPEEVLGKNPRILKSGEHDDDFYAKLWDTVLAGKVFRGMSINKKKDGSLYYEEKTITPVRDKNGNITHLISTGKDVTERVEAEQALAKSERFLQTILDTMPGALFMKDRNGTYLGCNAYFAKVAGLTPEEIIGKNDYDMPWEKEQADAFRADDAEVMSSGKYKLGIIEPQLQADGTNAWLETNKIALTDDEGKIYGVLGTFVDVTDRIKLEEQAKASLDQRIRQVNLSTSIAQEIASAPDLNDLYQRVVTQIKEQLGYYHVQLLRNAPVLDTLVLIAGYGEAGQKMMEMNHSMPMGVGLIGQAAKNKQSVLRPNVTEDLNWQSNPLLPKTRSELAIPIRLKDEILGVLDVQSDKIDGISQDDQLLLEGLCGQIAIAIESTTLRQEMEGRLRELNLLQRQMSREGWHKLGKEEKKGYRFDLSGLQKLHSLQEEIVQQNGNGAVTEPAQAKKPQLPMKKQLQVRGETIGNFGIEDDPERPLTNEEREIIDAVAQELAEALEAARLFEQTQKALAEQERLASELETVAQVSTAASTILEADELLQSVVDLAKTSFNLYHAHIYLVNETGKKLVLKAGAGNIGRLMSLEGREIGFDEESIVARAARTRKGVLENHVRRTVDFLPHPLLPETQSEMALPMLVGGKLIGILDLQSDQENFFSDEDLNVQTTLAAQIAVAVENANQYAAQVQTAVKLREVDQLKSEFLASMSHELRTPLNSIIGFADVLLEGLDGDLNDRMEEDVRLIRESGNHLKGLIGDILDMSKIEAGRMDLRYEEIDIVRFTQDLVATASSLAHEKNLYLNLDIDEAVTTVQADRTRLRQIMWNIVGNGIKFTDKGGVTIAIQPQANYLLCSIRDTGVGIKEEHAEVVFEQFRQIDGGLNRAAGGTGLGMPITKKLVELHGGDIWIESVYGQGSTFFFTLPYEPPRLKSKQANAVAG